MTRSSLRFVALALLAGAPLFLQATPAQACGGFFCGSQPIAQSGENILFSMESDGSITAVVQILYTGPANQFAWILPVPAVPTLGVGTDALFQQIDGATHPYFQYDYRTEGTCRMIPSSCYGYGWFDGDRSGPTAGGAADAATASDSGPSVTIISRVVVGPYDAVVLTGTDAAAITDWLTANEFLIPPGAADKLGIYVAKGDDFVALKLRKDLTAGDIQPVTLHYTYAEPCIPIELTAIATVDDMPITAYFVADHDMAASNYVMTEVDLDQPNLWTGTLQYTDAVSRAVDDAGGHAFVRDYEGTVPSLYLTLPSVSDLATTSDPKAFFQSLLSRGYRGDSQLLAIFQTYLPPPTASEATTFYNCLAQSWCTSYDSYLATVPFDPSALAHALDVQVVQPRIEAQAMLTRHTRLTRLFTTMSAAEMTLDPDFAAAPTRDVSNVHTATMITRCSAAYLPWSAPQDLVLPSGRSMRLRDGVPYYGTDAELCMDYGSGSFSPWTPVDRLRATSSSRTHAIAAGGGGIICSVTPARGALVAIPILGLALVVVAGRRTRRRRS